ncbi:glycosyltransferase family 2 protein [Desulfobaculum sp.]
MSAVSVCIPVYGRQELTLRCLEALCRHSPARALEVVVVDNGSLDGTPQRVPQRGAELFGERFVYVRRERNDGFAIACNEAARHATTPLLFFLNNDAEVCEGWLAPLLKVFREERRIGAAGPVLTYPETGRVQHCGIAFDPFLHPVHLYEHFPPEHPVVRQRRRVQALTGAALMMPGQVFADVGGFDEGYVNGYEDMDLCLRLRGAGWRLVCVPESRAEHATSCTPGRFANEDANVRRFRERCGDALVPDAHRIYEADGFLPRFNDWLSLYVAMPGDTRVALDAGVWTERKAVEQALMRHPLWENGYLFWHDIAEREGCGDTAFLARFLRAALFPGRESFIDFAQAAGNTGDVITQRIAMARLKQAEARQRDGEGLRARADAIADAAEQSGDDVALRMCVQWFRREGRGGTR